MKLKTFVIVLGVYLAIIGAIIATRPVGEAVPQNKLALIIDSITFNNGANAYMKAADDQAALKLLPDAKGAQANLVKAKKVEIPIDPNHIHVLRGRRLPAAYSANPAICVFKFDLGLQQFTYSNKRSYECPNPNQIEADCIGGHVSFDINLQLEIDRDISDAELGVELFHFIHDQRLQNHRGQEHVLEYWAEQMLHTFVGGIMKSHIATLQLADAIREKEELSNFLMKTLNERYNQYGIKFRTAAITSAVRLPQDQQARIDSIVMREYQNMALEKREQEYMPVLTQMQTVDQEGRQKIQNQHNRGQSESIHIIAEANKRRRDTFNKLIGSTNYVELERWIQMNKALVSGGNTTVVILPKSLQYTDGLTGLPRPTKADVDEHIFGVRTSQRTSTDDSSSPNQTSAQKRNKQ